MNYKTAYQFDADGKFLGETKAFASPLEDGVYLLPALTTFVAPPSVASDEFARWDGNSWGVEKYPTPEPEPEPEPVNPIDAAEAHVAQYFSTARLLQMKVWWDTFPPEDVPKLAAVFNWTGSVTIKAAQGKTDFGAPPYTFEEVLAEAMEILGVTP